MENNMHLDMFEQSCSINGKQMNGAADQPSVYPPARLGSLNVEENGDYAARTYGYDGFSNIHVDVAGGGVASSDADVLFYDYDGTLLYSYTKEDFLALTAMPDNPSHEGLVAQGWNWTLADAQAYVNTNEKQIIGQMYTTSDGRTRIYINLITGYLSPTLNLTLSSDTEVDIDWGDGSEHTTLVSDDAAPQHIYSTAGNYVISFAVIKGTVTIPSGNAAIIMGSTDTENRTYSYSINCIEYGSGIQEILGGVWCCASLRKISIPPTVTTLGASLFQYNYSLNTLIIPNSISNLPNYLCRYASGLNKISLPNSITNAGNEVFAGCYYLDTLVFPDSLSSVPVSCCKNMMALNTVILPVGVKQINNAAFMNCAGLREILIPNSVTSIHNEAFSQTLALTINVDKTTNAISGAPWNAMQHVVVNWLQSE